MKCSLKCLLTPAMTLFLGAAQARADAPAASLSDPATLLGAKSAGRAGATVPSPTTYDSLNQNPAGSVFSQKYAITVGYASLGDAIGASIVDTKSGPLGGGVYYVKRDLRSAYTDHPEVGDYGRIEDRAGFSLFGKPSAAFGFGINVKYAYRRSYDSRYASTKNWNGDIGARYVLSDAVTIGIVGQNLLTDDTGLNPRMLSLGVEATPTPGLALSLQLSKLTLATVDNDVSWAVGAQYEVYQGVSLRTGYRDNRPWNQKLFAAGLGYEHQSFGIDYALQTAVSGKGGTVHMLNLTGYL